MARATTFWTASSAPTLLIGGVGNDTYIVDDSNDVVAEFAGQGKDTVRSNADYQLKEGEEIETLILSSIGLIIGKGNSVNNVITVTGGGYGSLHGEGGNDTITGAAGATTFAAEAATTSWSAAMATTSSMVGLARTS